MTHESLNEQVRIVEQLQQKLRADHIEHFYITEPSQWQSEQLVLAGSFDFTYYHNVEITFTGWSLFYARERYSAWTRFGLQPKRRLFSYIQ